MIKSNSTSRRFDPGRFALARRQHGVTAIEYALIAALIAMVIVGSVTLLGVTVSDFYNFVSGEVAKAAAPAGN